MVPADPDRTGELSSLHHLVNSHAKVCSFSIAKPAHSRGESLEFHLFARFLDPPCQSTIMRKSLENQFVYFSDILCFSHQRGPSEWSSALAEVQDGFRQRFLAKQRLQLLAPA